MTDPLEQPPEPQESAESVPGPATDPDAETAAEAGEEVTDLTSDSDHPPAPPEAEAERGPVGVVKAKKKAKARRTGLGSDRGIETMFRTSYRVQLDLTSLADNKANIMISINGLIIPIMLFALVPLFRFSAWLILPSAVLVFSCLISIVYAVLSARPRIFPNPVTRSSIEAGKANILFFGNFAHLREEEFLQGMNLMLAKPGNVYVNMIRDIYGMGRVLSKKFALLKKAYDVFVVGLITSIVLYMGIFIGKAMGWIA